MAHGTRTDVTLVTGRGRFKHQSGDICHPVLESERSLGEHHSMKSDPVRDQMIKQRRSLADDAVQRASARTMARVMELDEFQAAGRFAAYVGMRGEIDPWPSLLAENLCVALPVIQPRGDLEFVIPEGPLQPGPFGTSQPASGERVRPERLDVVLVPLVAADRRGNRIGHGAGYYDRTFAFRLSQPTPPTLIGIAHSFQVVPVLEPRSWDVPLDILVTDKGILRPKPPIGED